MAKSDFSCVELETRFFPGSRHSAAVLQTQVPKLCTDPDLSLLYISMMGTYSKFARKNDFSALGVRFPQPFSSTGRRPQVCRIKITFTQLPTNRFVPTGTTKISMKCVVNWIPLRICVRSPEKYSTSPKDREKKRICKGIMPSV